MDNYYEKLHQNVSYVNIWLGLWKLDKIYVKEFQIKKYNFTQTSLSRILRKDSNYMNKLVSCNCTNVVP